MSKLKETKICRLCLSQASVYFSLLESDTNQMLESLTSQKVLPNDTYPTVSCIKCLLNVKLAFRIQQNILKNVEKLKEMFDKMEIKSLNSELDLKPLESSDIQSQINEQLVNIKIENDNEINIDDQSLTLCHSNCKVCGLEVDEAVLKNHIQEHFNSSHECNSCEITFDDFDSYKNHLANHHDNNSFYTCKECKSTFQYESLYNIHINKAHKKDEIAPRRRWGESEPTTCEICDRKFPTRRLYKKHTYSAHSKAKCNICNNIFTTSNLARHMLIHYEGQQCICEICGSVAKNKESLRGHYFHAHKHAKSEYKCEVEDCGRMFRQKYALSLHQRRDHTGERPHICDSCGKPFTTFHDLNTHIKAIHLKLKPHSCDTCGRKFGSRYGLKSHIRQHTNENPYRCEFCGEGFKQNVSLRTHKKSKHNMVEPITCNCEICGKGFATMHAVKAHRRLH